MNEQLNEIARSYHQKGLPDMHIEKLCQEYEINWLLSTIGASSLNILDLGFGDGINFEPLAKYHNLTLVEGSDALAKNARLRSVELGLDVKVHCGLFEEFYSETRFDLIVASHVLEHVDQPINLLTHLEQFLKPGGRLIGIVPNSESLHRRLGVAMGLHHKLDDLSERDKLVGHQRVYNLTELKNDLNNGGFAIIEHRGFFAKLLANHQMLHLDERVLGGLLSMSDNLPSDFCANIGFVAIRLKDSNF